MAHGFESIRSRALSSLATASDVLPEEELPRVRVLQVWFHVAELLSIQTLGGRYHRAVNVDEDVAVEAVLLAVVLEAEDYLLRLAQRIRRDQDYALALHGGLVDDLDHGPHRLAERLGLLVRERCLHDEQVYVLDVWETRRGDGEVIFERDVPGVKYGRRAGLEEDASRPRM